MSYKIKPEDMRDPYRTLTSKLDYIGHRINGGHPNVTVEPLSEDERNDFKIGVRNIVLSKNGSLGQGEEVKITRANIMGLLRDTLEYINNNFASSAIVPYDQSVSFEFKKLALISTQKSPQQGSYLTVKYNQSAEFPNRENKALEQVVPLIQEVFDELISEHMAPQVEGSQHDHIRQRSEAPSADK